MKDAGTKSPRAGEVPQQGSVLGLLMRGRHAEHRLTCDPYRAILFPNAIREQRRRTTGETLLALAERIPSIPYIRLSKIERGEVAAKAPELQAIAAALGVQPHHLLVDPDAPDFDLAKWVAERGDVPQFSQEAEELAILLAAAFRRSRAADPDLTLARLQAEYGLPAVIVSRIENAAKTPDRWNAQTMEAICRVIGLERPEQMKSRLEEDWASGILDEWAARVPGASEREAKTRVLIGRLRAELSGEGGFAQPAVAWLQQSAPVARAVRDSAASIPLAPLPPRLTVYGAPLGEGRIDPLAQDGEIDPPPGAGVNSYALRMCRASLGAAIPGRAILIVDPDQTPAGDGLAILRDGEAVRVLAVTTGLDGRMTGHSLNPAGEWELDTLPPDRLDKVTAILLD